MAMKRYVVYVLIIIIVFIFALINFISENRVEEIRDYCYDINVLIKDYNFATAKIDNSVISLYDANGKTIEIVPFSNYDEDCRIQYISKKDALIYFVTEGFADDVSGIVFINDDTNGLFDGITNFKRIGGNSYKFAS